MLKPAGIKRIIMYIYIYTHTYTNIYILYEPCCDGSSLGSFSLGCLRERVFWVAFGGIDGHGRFKVAGSLRVRTR